MDEPKARLGGAPIPARATGRVLLSGDIHGDINWWRSLCRTAVRHDCDTILQLGDFGMWPNDLDRWVGAVTWCLEHFELHARVIDGNHDWHPGARERFEASVDGVRPIHDGRLDWADRGARWVWHGHQFAALGGAVSVDQAQRTKPGDGVPVEAETWWPTEAITASEAADVIGGGPVDVLVTHDAPVGCGPDFALLADPLQTQMDTNRRHISDVVRATKPSLVVHGHLHTRYTEHIRIGDDAWTNVEGLASNIEGNTQAWAILDLTDLSVTSGHTPPKQRT